ncbi:MAG: hypothetical protein JXR65_00005, partial [Bacteroidales bacterium]|nr:hypothetical protein [Bacteroidales bacterium]
QVIAQACSAGNLELNQLMPLIAHSFLESLTLLSNASKMFAEKCISGIKANENICKKNVENSTAVVTALIPKLGYNKADQLADMARKQKLSIREAAILHGLITREDFEELISPEAVCRLGN